MTSARSENEPASTGDRVWTLPDLPPQGEVQFFQIQLQFLSAESRTVPIVVEIDGDGFDVGIFPRHLLEAAEQATQLLFV